MSSVQPEAVSLPSSVHVGPGAGGLTFVTVDGPAGRWLCRVVAVDDDRAATTDVLGAPA